MVRDKILVVDDESLIAWSLAKMLEKAGFRVETAGTCVEALAKLRALEPDLVMLDIWLPDGNGLDLLKEFKRLCAEVPVIMITASADADSALAALKLGAEDYIGKPFSLDAVRLVVEKALEKKEKKEDLAPLNNELRRRSEQYKLVGSSPEMVEVFKMIRVCADTDAKTVLILGESGTGKELVARAIHTHSARSEAPFIEINCAAIPENLLESELFGHEKGAYTDAAKRRKGVFEQSEGGTVFLDEIGDMPLSMQAKILKVIETRRFRRLGGEDDIAADVRIIAATHQDLPGMVREKRFRSDLYFRLNVMTIPLPQLFRRKEDIPVLVNYFIRCLNEEYGKNVEGISSEMLQQLLDYNWPGNVRELRNAIERAMMLEQKKVISSAYLNNEIKQYAGLHGKDAIGRETGDNCSVLSMDRAPGVRQINVPPEGISIDELEKHLIITSLEIAGGNQTRAARFLKMSRDTLRYRMKKFGLGQSVISG